jgi:hypothetical protein
MWLVTWIEQNKDLFLVISALLAPFAAVFVGLKTATRQSTALIESTELQVRSAALRDARQRSWEKLRDEFAAQVVEIMEVNYGLNLMAKDDVAARLRFTSIEARSVRIGLTVSSKNSRAYSEWATHEDAVFGKLRQKRRSGRLTKEEEDQFISEIQALRLLARNVLEREEIITVGETDIPERIVGS